MRPLGMRTFCPFMEQLLLGHNSLGRQSIKTTDHGSATRSFLSTEPSCCTQIKCAAARER